MGSQSELEVQHLLDIANRMALRWCRSAPDAEDVAQDAMIRYVAATPPPANPLAWLHVVVRRLSNRSRLRNLARMNAEAGFVATQHPTRADLDLLLELNTVLSRLGERHRRIIVLLAGGAQSREIAAAFGVQVRDVGQMVARARRIARRVRNDFGRGG